MILWQEPGRLLGIITQPRSKQILRRAPILLNTRVDRAAPHKRHGDCAAREPLHVGPLRDALLRLDLVVGVLVEGGVGEVVVRADAVGCLAGVDGAAADEARGLVFADVEGAWGVGAGGAQGGLDFV